MDLNTLVLTAADYNTVISIPTSIGKVRYLLLTSSELTYDVAVEGEYSYAIGSNEPYANKTNAKSYKINWTMQAGELNAILQLCGFRSAVDIQGATVTIAALVGAFVMTFKNVNILGDSGSITAKGKETMRKLTGQAIGLA
jgi:hypothetical protein